MELTCLHYDCPSFTEHDISLMTCLNLAHYIAHVMSARAQSDKVPEFYMQIALTFEFPLY